jgi:isopenicillin-N epimerase
MPSPFASLWALDPAVAYLNHGSFGACPKAVLEYQSALRLELEREPVDFLWRQLPVAAWGLNPRASRPAYVTPPAS